MAIPDSILLKPGALTEEERELVKQHPKFAYDMLKRIEFLLPAIDIPYCHHEKWDGSGYPRGLKGEEIPFAARIFPVVDVWDALTSDRPYRKGLPVDEVKERIRAEAGRHFDPRVVDAFLAMDDYSI
jgi:HD-GYP domain-containing protein (c-di-GMP phosphodiesterase class II)